VHDEVHSRSHTGILADDHLDWVTRIDVKAIEPRRSQSSEGSVWEAAMPRLEKHPVVFASADPAIE